MAVYFVQDSRSRAVKVGYSTNVAKRVSGLRTSCPYPLLFLGSIPGGLKRERELHRRFSSYFNRLCGEWYEYSDELMAYVFSLINRHHTVWEQCLERNRCRFGLRGLRMRHLAGGDVFECGGSFWDEHTKLFLFTRPEQYRPGFVPDNEFEIILASQVFDAYLPYRDDEILDSAECVLIDHWPVTCCQPEIGGPHD